MIDEFQDFSTMFFELVSAIRTVNPDVQFFCVGDDWQAIYGFAGSDLRFFTGFAQYFQNTSQHYIATNYRSPKSVVAVGNALMKGRGPAARAYRGDNGQVQLCKLDEFKPTALEQAQHNWDEITPAVLRLVRRFLDRGMDVVMLSRRNRPPWYVNYPGATLGTSSELERFAEHVRSFLPEDDRKRVTVSSVHRYKGLEKPTVVVLDAKEGSYPLIHPNWVFLRVFGDTIEEIEEEERRLFYVAITRAKDSLALMTENLRESLYLDDIRRHVRLDVLSWDELPPILSLQGAHVEIRVFNAFAVKDELKELKYRWNSAGKYWHRSVPEETFSLDTLLTERWARDGVKVEVWSESGELLHRRV